MTDNLFLGMNVGNLWSCDGRYNSATLQPIVYYNFDAWPGIYFGYDAVIGADWKQRHANAWTVPVGATLGRTCHVGGGHGVDLGIGTYWYVLRPPGGPTMSLRFGISWLF